MKNTMKKIATMVAKIFMEILTCVFAVTCGCLAMDILYEYTSWGIGQGEDAFYGGIFALMAYMVIRYQTRERVNNYLEKINPKIEHVAGMLNQINETSKEDKVA